MELEWEREPLYYAKDRRVFKRPISRKTQTGTIISIGFPVCIMHEAVGCEEDTANASAKVVAELMNRGEMAPTLYQTLMRLTSYVTTHCPDTREWHQDGRPVVLDATALIWKCRELYGEEKTDATCNAGRSAAGAVSDPL